MRHLWKRIADIGIGAGTSREEANVFRIINSLCGSTAVVSALFSLFCLIFALLLPFWASNLIMLGMIGPPALLHFGRVFASKVFFIGQYIFICFFLCFLFGEVTRAEFGALNIPIFVFIFFQKRSAPELLCSGFLLFLACKALIELHELVNVPAFPRVFEYLVTFVNFTCFFATVYFFIHEMIDSQAQLSEKNALLAEALLDQKKSQARTESLNLELQQFASLASHDKEPLRTISSFSALLARRVPDDPASRDFLNFIKDAARRMALFLDDLIGYARRQAREPFFCSFFRSRCSKKSEADASTAVVFA